MGSESVKLNSMGIVRLKGTVRQSLKNLGCGSH
jgi:hypothetical protein